MKQLAVISGKGGTGKTTITAGLADLISRKYSLVIADADVDAANLGLVLDPNLQEEHIYMSGELAVVDRERCSLCGTCIEVCRFHAVRFVDKPEGQVIRIDEIACEGCRACSTQCPQDAIRMEPLHAGMWYRSGTRFGPLIHAHLFAGQENSGRLVTMVRKQAKELGQETGKAILLIDGPPGISCPVISTITGVDLALLVVEPTISGVHDLGRVLETTSHFNAPAMVVINKADLNPQRTAEIKFFCEGKGIGIAGTLPYDVTVAQAIVAGIPITQSESADICAGMDRIWTQIHKQLVQQPSNFSSNVSWS
jgi:MinD superfamily P-loop ATPase